MKTLIEIINIIKKRVTGIWSPQESTRDPVAEEKTEQTEQEEHVDIFLNPLGGVNIVRHLGGRRPRRA